MDFINKIKEWATLEKAIDHSNIASNVLTALTHSHNGALPTQDVTAIFEEVESRLTEALIRRRKEICQESEIIDKFLKRNNHA